MKIRKITYQHRRDFKAIYECEHCGYIDEVDSWGYDDTYFHKNVIPKMKCPKCGKTAGLDYVPRKTKYADNKII